VDVRLPREGAEAVWGALVGAGAALGLKLLGLDELEVLRVEAGIPRYGADMDDKTIPLEANLERAIHYNKGCYIGQEVIARATFRGHMNRKLTGLLLGGAAPSEGEAFSEPVRRLERGEPAPEGRVELFAGEKKVGWLTTSVWSSKLGQAISLGYVHRDFLTAGTKLAIAGGGEAEVRELPFVPRG
jgi:aminomethyltransferase